MTKIPVKKFAYRLIVFTVVMAVLAVLFQLIFQDYCTPALPYIVLFFFLLTLFTLYIPLRNPSKTQGTKFVSSYLLSRIIKFFACFVFLLLYLLLNKNDRISFAISFIVIYFAYSCFEVVILKKESREK